MIKLYILERKSWIAFILFTHIVILFIAYVDSSIPLQSYLYIVFLVTIFFSLFVIFRYFKETKFYKQLSETEISNLIEEVQPTSSFEKIVKEKLEEQEVQLKSLITKQKSMLEQEQDELLSWVHEVKTPLTSLHLLIERIEDTQLKSQLTYEWLRVHLLLDQQIHQKRITFIENDLFMEKVNLQQTIHQEIKFLQSWCFQKGIGFDLDLKEADVISDGKWLGFIIRQLLTNAVKYSRHDDIFIKSDLYDGHIRLIISDKGQGIDVKDLPRIFEKGFTSTTNHQNHQSTGMGLYLTKKAADSLHINVKVRSKVEAGTTVVLTFPKRNEFTLIRSK
ncbi:sensor histidine kinase [Bacillus carboniphilus]|uniref:histidine kinase n=1 Tax=Bacillus carboniphilus TaxID=86663 RepID=A0ABY9JSU8_9BACI|nr:sensor histidine kinase [Bacillus carboniphilus]WLR41813.1 sensor histidine kinase [Bacillus carboniphilus]